jgi:uncharacterized membrane protein YvlD (DUF360 family)
MKGRALWRFARWAIGVAVLQAGVLAVLAWLLPGFAVGDAGSVVVAALLFTAAQALAWPFVYRLATRLHPLLFPVLSFALAGVLIVLLTDLVSNLGIRGLHVAGIGTGILIACGLTVGGTLLGVLFPLRAEAVATVRAGKGLTMQVNLGA